MTFNMKRATAMRMAIESTSVLITRQPEGDAKTLLTEHLALLQEAELIYLTDAFVGEGEERISTESESVLPDLNEFAARNEKFARDNGLRGDPHAELRKTWAPGQRWQGRTPGAQAWGDISGMPGWARHLEYRRHPDDIDPHAELRETWAPGQRWQILVLSTWMDMPNDEAPLWDPSTSYRRHPYDIDQPTGPKWVDWAGGKVPVKTGTRIEVKHRSGETYITTAGGDYAMRWTHEGHDTDIVAYKAVK